VLSKDAMFAASPGSAPVANQASSISMATGALVDRRLITRTFASFHRRAPAAVAASPHSAARTPRTLLAAIDAPWGVRAGCAKPRPERQYRDRRGLRRLVLWNGD